MSEQNNMPPDVNTNSSSGASTARQTEASSTQNNSQRDAGAGGSDSTSNSSQQQQYGSSSSPRRHRRSGGSGTHDQRRQGQQQQRDASSSSSNSRRPEAAVNMDELREVVDLIAERGFTDFELEREGFRIRLRRDIIVGGQSNQPMTSAPFANPFVQTPSAMPTSLPMPSTPTSSAATTDASSQTQTATGAESATTDENLETIKSPIVGTFYRAPSPTAESFVKAGSSVEPSTVVCIVEAMKLMNEILAETSGTIEKIYVENGQPVEYGQPLFGVRK